MNFEDEVTSIRFGCNSLDLLGSEDPSYYDVPACMQRYEGLCRDTLRKMYPDAEIDILIESDERTLVNGLADHQHIDTIEQVRDHIFQNFEWEVRRIWLDVVEAHNHSGTPVSVIRWACTQGLIEEAKKVKRCWKFPLETFRDAQRKNKILVSCSDVLELVVTNEGNYDLGKCHPYELLEAGTDEIADGTHLLVVPSAKFQRLPWFTKDNLTLLISLTASTAILEIVNFGDADTQIEMKWSFDAFARSLFSQSRYYSSVHVEMEMDKDRNRRSIDGVRFTFSFNAQRDRSLLDFLHQALNTLSEMAWDAEIELGDGPKWLADYEVDEIQFCQKVLGPLLRRMGFLDVRYTHGVSEAGKDFTFSEMTKFGDLRHGALQAKAGDVNGRVSSPLRELLGQIEDAFENPYDALGDPTERWISTFVIAISGSFTEQAEKKIRDKIKKSIVGSVHFLDKEKILGLIDQYWSSNK